MTSKRRWIAVGAVGVVGTAAIAVTVVASGGSDAQTTTATSSAATTKIVVQDLEERESVDGTLGYSDARPVVNRLAGTVTWTPRLGSVVETNHKLYEVDGDAVYLLNGAYPAYRTLTAGLKGDDVLALERNLRELGLDSGHDMSVNRTWDAGTTAAVKRWQRRKGLDDTGTIEKGRIVFQPGARRIGSIKVAAGQSASGGGGGSSNAPASSPDTASTPTNVSFHSGESVDRAQPAVATAAVSSSAEPQVTMVLAAARTQTNAPAQGEPTAPATTPTETTPTETTPGESSPDKTTPDETKPDKTKPENDGPKAADPAPSTGAPKTGSGGAPSGGSGAFSGGSGGTGAPSGGSGAPSGGSGGVSPAATGSSSAASSADVSATVMTTTSVKRIVAVDLEATKQSLAKRGAKVSVEMPDGKDVPGTIATVSAVAVKKATASNEDPPATVKLVIKLTRSAGTGLDQAPVDVQLTQSRAKDVLTVPVTALIAQQGGKFAVEVREGTSRRIVEVETGLYTDSYVEIEGQGLRAGMAVTNARV